MNDGPRARLRENAEEIAAVAVTGFWLAAFFTGQSWWLAALLVGYVVVLPVVEILFGGDGDGEAASDGEPERTEVDEAAPDNRDALATLRRRYARGELTDEQFERKLERLLETESVEQVEDRRRERDRLRER